MADILQQLRTLDDGISRPVSIIEREACGHAASTIEALADALKHCLREHGGFTIRGESERKAVAALAMVSPAERG